MTEIPASYRQWLQALPFEEISIGVGGLRFASLDELNELQIGYSSPPDGSTFCTGEAGAWQEHWVVIGQDTCLGDPVILDTSKEPIAVYTAMHGAGEWDPVPIAGSLEGLSVALDIVKNLSVGREHPVALEANPISQVERNRALSRIAAANPGIDLSFWALQLGSAEG